MDQEPGGMLMRTTLRWTVVAAGAALALGASPTMAMQDARIAMAAPEPPVVERADELRAEAEALFPQPKRWSKAMRLLEESASLRAASDPAAYDCLVLAGRLAYAIGDNPGALQNLRKAAEHALARGAVMDAANAYIDAAHVAKAARNVGLAEELVERAQLLTMSPLLSDRDRAVIDHRLRA
jgi:tetratricopeptide (TPR) repeat protein